ncbi:GNAT family N-acetyltransferase [Myroides guanonis]|uniref:Acetyltransferase (GNAT) domain-containing protein n=1 Tax=Myroides guanonis TaxID=1150112 RepID=A0A1I3L4V9_9FLAO|nr:GNAT family N-acetyltransferase [Myroides guanonis]SFI79616.1 Acetyltransferase (GNAT) domain-containing protein [Myroides guanonis]
MKKELSIKRLSDDNYLFEIITMHKEIFIETEFYGRLIYFDDDFKNYFRTILSDKDHYVFGIFSDNDIHGFIHLKAFSNTLFLNNIFLDESIRGNGNGTNVLKEVLNSAFIVNEDFVNIELDVLESNFKAKNWYRKIGLTPSIISHWYFLKKSTPLDIVNLYLDYDLNGFKGVFLDNTKLGTIINDSSIIVHDLKVLDYKCNLLFIAKITGVPKVSNIEFLQFDSSIRMNSKITNVLKTMKDV